MVSALADVAPNVPDSGSSFTFGVGAPAVRTTLSSNSCSSLRMTSYSAQARLNSSSATRRNSSSANSALMQSLRDFSALKDWKVSMSACSSFLCTQGAEHCWCKVPTMHHGLDSAIRANCRVLHACSCCKQFTAMPATAGKAKRKKKGTQPWLTNLLWNDPKLQKPQDSF
jgi:hypothetical protein